ncbi:MAG: glycosyltransferase family 2 protein, partial [Proteobacteria bacterium]|nr:glycosyltransferase family 2 protein [Pseudomonadota bacterium]
MPTKETPPLFAIAVPAWRASATIGTAVASVLAQTETRFELIVIDDGCPDHSGAHAAHAANGDPRVRIVMQPNQGPSAARNAAVAASTAPLIAFLDADDRWRPETLARHRDAFADPSLGVSFARIRFF